ncbi:hypothetical protein SAMN02910317_03115 [Ruminococcaceae bacterium FB2012]|nr:hypothetical protein SAMN02910317_03115 [Ruminococcaceae bacterium FB2012]
MKKKYLVLLAALTMLVTAASCGSGDSSSGTGSSAGESTSSAAEAKASTADTSSAADTASAPAESSGEVSEAPADDLPAMDSAYKVLDCLDVEGTPSEIFSCGNTVAVQCHTTDKDGHWAVKYYIVDAVKDELIRTVDAGNDMEILLGTDAEGGLTAMIWKDWVNESDDPQQLVFYKPDGTRNAVEYNGDLMFVKCDLSGQLYDLGKGVAKLGSDLSREVIFDCIEAEETQILDVSRDRAVVSYLKDSFTQPTTLMLADTSTGKEITELEAAHVTDVDGAGDYVVVTCIPDYETYDYYTSVYEKETGKLLWTWSEEHEGIRYDFYEGSSYGVNCGNTEIIDPLTYNFLRVSDGATGTLKPDIPDVVRITTASVTSADRLISAVAVGDLQKNDTKVKLVMIDPAQVNFDGSVEKCDPYKYSEETGYKCGDKFKELRAKADALEEKYGVRILIGDEVPCLDETNDAYRYVSAEGGEWAGSGYSDTEAALNSLDKRMGEYPEGFFDEFKARGKGGICIALAGDLADKYTDSSFAAAGQTYCYGLWTIIPVITDYADHALNHEMFHAVEFLVDDRVGAIDEDEWNALNPEGFEYSKDFDGYADGEMSSDHIYGYDDDPYFARDYGKVTPLEDRATLIEMLFTDAYNDPAEYRDYIEDITEKSPHLKAKIDFLADWTKQLFGYVYWEKMLGTET